MKPPHVGLAALLVGAVTLTAALDVSAQALGPPPCDSLLARKALGSHGYGPRGDRCEGIYSQQVSGVALVVASLTESFEDFTTAGKSTLTVEWSLPGDSAVHLRVRGIRPQLYYGMDAVRPGASRSYLWPTDLLAFQHIRRSDIGALGWTRLEIGGVLRTVYVPLRISQQQAPADGARYDLAVVPGVRLDTVFVSLVRLDREGRAGSWLKRNERLPQQYLPAGRAIHIMIGGLAGSGIYEIQISARRPDGGAVSIEPLLFYHRERE